VWQRSEKTWFGCGTFHFSSRVNPARKAESRKEPQACKLTLNLRYTKAQNRPPFLRRNVYTAVTSQNHSRIQKTDPSWSRPQLWRVLTHPQSSNVRPRQQIRYAHPPPRSISILPSTHAELHFADGIYETSTKVSHTIRFELRQLLIRDSAKSFPWITWVLSLRIPHGQQQSTEKTRTGY